MLWILITILIAFAVLMIVALCMAAGRTSRLDEQREEMLRRSDNSGGPS